MIRQVIEFVRLPKPQHDRVIETYYIWNNMEHVKVNIEEALLKFFIFEMHYAKDENRPGKSIRHRPP